MTADDLRILFSLLNRPSRNPLSPFWSIFKLQIAFPLVHDLGILVALLPDDKMPPEGFALIELNPFASVRRYHEGDIPLSNEEINASLDVAHRVVQWAQANTSK